MYYPLIVNFNKGWRINKNHKILSKPTNKINELNEIIDFNIPIPENSLNIPCTYYKSSLMLYIFFLYLILFFFLFLLSNPA